MKKRILFVDDDPSILEAFRFMFEAMKTEWNIFFANGGPAALDLMKDHPFDVIVTDMRMPGMNGVQLLTEVMQRYPRTARFIISGYADQEQVARSIGTAHQFLTKPCDLAVLRSTLTRVCALDVFLRNETLKALVAKMTVLPSVPKLYFRMLEELQSPDASIDRIAQCVSADPTMTAKLLQLVNSAFFGFARRVSHPAEAIQLLGIANVRSLALLIHAFSCYDRSKTDGLPLERLWNHSLATGMLARAVSEGESQDATDADEAFIAGLLHDLGKLMLVSNMPAEYRRCLTLSKEKNLPISEAETRVFGATHADVGGYLLGLWGLPATIVEAVALHHTPQKSPTQHFCPLTAVHVANVLEHQSGTVAGETNGAEFDHVYLTQIGLQDRIPQWQNTASSERWAKAA